jgi:hypothetical protein
MSVGDKDIDGKPMIKGLSENSRNAKELMFSTEGIVIVAAGITNLSLYVYDYLEQRIEIEEELDVIGDIGSYLNVMQLLKKPDGEDNTYYLFLGTTEGCVNIFELSFKINYDKRILDDFTKELKMLEEDENKKEMENLIERIDEI